MKMVERQGFAKLLSASDSTCSAFTGLPMATRADERKIRPVVAQTFRMAATEGLQK
jgi:hypothetical protein